MNNKYITLEDLEKDLKDSVWPSDIASLSFEEQKKYLERSFNIILNMYNSLGLNSKFNINDAVDLIEKYIDDSPYGSEYEKRLDDFLYDWSRRFQDEVLDGLNNGYKADETLCQNVNELVYINSLFPGVAFKYEEIFSKIISQNKDLIRYYQGKDSRVYQTIINEGYLKVDEILNVLSRLTNLEKADICRCIIKVDYDAVVKSDFYKINPEYLIISFIINNDCDNEIFKRLVSDLDIFLRENIMANLFTDNVYQAYLDNINIETLNILIGMRIISYTYYEKLFSKMFEKDFNLLELYRGAAISNNLIKEIFNANNKYDENLIFILNDYYENHEISDALYSRIFIYILEKNQNLCQYYIGKDIRVYRIMIQNNINIDRKLLVNLLVYSNDLTKEDLNIIFDKLGIKPFDYMALKSYKGDIYKLIDNFDKIDYFLELLNINREMFIGYAFASSYKWLDSILYIFDNNKLNDLINVKNYLFSNLYKINDKEKSILSIQKVIEIMKNFIQYPDLCINLLNENLNNDELSKLKILFENNNVIKNDDDSPIKTKDDLADIENKIFKNYQVLINFAMDEEYLGIVQSALSKILFNMTIDDVKNKLNEYGNIKVFRQLLFNNRNNPNVASHILDMMVYVSMMEDVVDCEDIDKLKSILSNINSNKDIYILCQKCNMMFRDFEEKMKLLYAEEMQANLTDLDNIPDRLIDKKMTKKYGVRVIDLTGSKYCLLEHVKSNSESIESLVSGRADGTQIFISLSLGSHRNQRLYTNGKSIIFGCDTMDFNHLIKTSTSNIGSNGFIKKYSYEVDTKYMLLTQRGALETSSAISGSNSEILCYRDGIKFDYIILPGGRDPTIEEIGIARKYNLTFVKVQELNEEILKPQDIYDTINNESNHQLGRDDLDNRDFSLLQRLLHRSDSQNQRKIAIFTDSHALFEPTLAILEDARRNGITEIYSLGDNIGTGPNPKEVMDLLDVYGVKSLKGNHELYVTLGVDALKKHLIKTGAYNEASENSGWTGRQLTEEQLEKIKAFPENMILEIGGKKIMLSHYMRDYNTEIAKEIPSGVDEVFQGHIHYESKSDNVSTLRGAGIGGEDGTASYVILTENPNGGYNVLTRRVKYDKISTHYDIIESDMASTSKDKIDKWIGGRSR